MNFHLLSQVCGCIQIQIRDIPEGYCADLCNALRTFYAVDTRDH
jgi:hypothetical protein